MGNSYTTYSEVIQEKGFAINLNKLIKPEYIGELEVDGYKYNYIIDINNKIQKMIKFFEESYNTEERQQTLYGNQSNWKQLLYEEWKTLIKKEVNIYKPEFTGNGETTFTNNVINKNGITFRILGQTLLPILIQIIINKDAFRNLDMLYRNLLYNSYLYKTIKTKDITLLDNTKITIQNLLEDKKSDNKNFKYDIYYIIKYIYIYFIISKKTSEEFKELSDILNYKSAKGEKYKGGKSKRGKSKRGKSKRGKSKREKSKRGKSKKNY